MALPQKNKNIQSLQDELLRLILKTFSQTLTCVESLV
jgi:hypothetical protein